VSVNKLLRPAGTWFAKPETAKLERKWRGCPTVSGKRTIVIKAPSRTNSEPGQVRCVRCHVVVNPGMTHQARVYTGQITLPIEKAKLLTVEPTVQYEEYTEKLKLPKFSVGHVCDTCAADYSHTTVEHRNGTTEEIQNVVTMPRAVGMKPKDENIGFVRRGFSKRMRVRGNTGSRHKPDNYYE